MPSGRLAGLVNNAGMTHKAAKLADFDTEFMARIFAVNTFGPMIATREAAQADVDCARRQGRRYRQCVVDACGLWRRRPRRALCRDQGGARSHFARRRCRDGGRGRSVNIVRPGPTETEMSGFADKSWAAHLRSKSTIPMGQMGQPQDVANAVLWLLSDEASYVTGAAINVSGGR